jgi:chromosomal replication initiation ATPase DnaA
MGNISPQVYVGIKYIPIKKKLNRGINTVASEHLTKVQMLSNSDKLESLLDFICKLLGVTVEEAKGNVRYAEIVRARQIYCYFAREMGFTFSKVASIINRDHATVIYGCKVVENRQFDFKILNDYNKIIENL